MLDTSGVIRKESVKGEPDKFIVYPYDSDKAKAEMIKYENIHFRGLHETLYILPNIYLIIYLIFLYLYFKKYILINLYYLYYLYI